MRIDQAEIHRKALNGNLKERTETVKQLRRNFLVLKDWEQAWADLHRLTGDEDRLCAFRQITRSAEHLYSRPQRQKLKKISAERSRMP